MTYNWQQSDRPEFRYDLDGVVDQMLVFANDAGRVSGLLEGIPEKLGAEAVLDFMIAEAVGSSAIEGETLNRDAVMSVKKSRFFQRYEPELNERQLKIVRRMFLSGPEGIIGGMNARKYVALTGASKSTATRDLQHLAQLGALTPLGGGRSTHYELGES